MSNKPNIHDILENACEKFGLTMGEAMAITKTPLHPRQLRDYFAAKAMHASMTADPANEADADSHARWAYEMADAMLKAREA